MRHAKFTSTPPIDRQAKCTDRPLGSRKRILLGSNGRSRSGFRSDCSLETPCVSSPSNFKKLRICLATIDNADLGSSNYIAIERYGCTPMSEEEATLGDGAVDEPQAIRRRPQRRANSNTAAVMIAQPAAEPHKSMVAWLHPQHISIHARLAEPCTSSPTSTAADLSIATSTNEVCPSLTR